MSALENLAHFAAHIEYDTLPACIADKTRACLLYGLAVAVASVRVPLSSLALAANAQPAGAGDGATRLIDGANVGAGDAAFANAMLFHARIQEDAHPAGHVGVVVLPALLAQAQSAHSSGRDLLAAIAAGYEIALRIGRDHAAQLSERGFRTTSVYGPIGAAPACARLRRSDAAAVANALALAANTACGLREFVDAGTNEYAFQAGVAAHNAVLSASLACAGARAAASVLEGAAGFYRAFGGEARSCAARLDENLGTVWEFEHVTFKPYPVCQFHRSLIGGVLALRQQASAAPFQRMTIAMHPYEADFFGVRYAGPFQTFSQAFMSAPFCAAVAWSHGRVDYAGMNDFESAAMLAPLPRIEVLSDAGRPRYQPSIRVTLDDGRELAWQDDVGPAVYQLDWDAAVRMAAQLFAEAGAPDNLRDQLIDAVAGLANDGKVADVVAAAAQACAAAAAHKL